jgi:hypothetical protein
MLNDPATPASAITARMRVDAPFREAVEASRIPNPAQRSEEQAVEDELGMVREFADAYRVAPSLKFFNGRVTIGDHQYTRAQLDENVEKASRLGLL